MQLNYLLVFMNDVYMIVNNLLVIMYVKYIMNKNCIKLYVFVFILSIFVNEIVYLYCIVYFVFKK